MQLVWKIQLGLLYLVSEISRLTDSFNCDRCTDANLCDTVTGTFSATQLGRGYHPVVTLPRGACNINVTEIADSNNILALKDVLRNDYILNGLWLMNGPGEYDGAGTKFFYHQSDSYCPGDCLNARGPILTQVLVQLLYHERNPGVFYTYKLPKHLKTTSHQPHTPDRSELRETEIGQETIPDVEPDRAPETHPVFPPRVPLPGPGGIRHRGPIFSSDFTHRRRPPHNRGTLARAVNQQRRQSLTDVTFSRGVNDVTYRREDVRVDGDIETSNETRVNSWLSVVNRYLWRSNQGECSRPCGGGIREDIYVCVDSVISETVDENYCDNSTKPETFYTVCNNEACTPQWSTGEWSECSVTCGKGTQSRDVTCKQRVSATYTQELDDEYCTSGKPALNKDCYKDPCYGWVSDDWGECSVTCGVGTRRRLVECREETGTVVDKNLCIQSMPVSQESCDMGSCESETRWYFSNWNSKCSEDCGDGKVTRSVHCATPSGQVKPDIYCREQTKPLQERECLHESGCIGKWFTGPWSQCSKSCGTGTKTRYVFCMITVGDRMVTGAESDCRADDKPQEQKDCTEAECGYTWYTTEWSSCSRSCGGGVSTRMVQCYNKEMMPTFQCHEHEKPDDTRICNTQRCTTVNPELYSTCVDKYPFCGWVLRERKCIYPYTLGCCRSCRYHNRLHR